MELLINNEDIQQYKSVIRFMLPQYSIDPYILESQNFDLRPILESELFYDFINSISEYRRKKELDPVYQPTESESKYLILLKGNNVDFMGVTPWLVYTSMARYVPFANVTSTEYGLETKKNDYSEPITPQMAASIAGGLKEGAKVYRDDVLKFLNKNLDTYPLFKSSCHCRTDNRNSYSKANVRFNAIGK